MWQNIKGVSVTSATDVTVFDFAETLPRYPRKAVTIVIQVFKLKKCMEISKPRLHTDFSMGSFSLAPLNFSSRWSIMGVSKMEILFLAKHHVTFCIGFLQIIGQDVISGMVCGPFSPLK